MQYHKYIFKLYVLKFPYIVRHFKFNSNKICGQTRNDRKKYIQKNPFLKFTGFLTICGCGLISYDGIKNQFQYTKTLIRFLRLLLAGFLITIDYIFVLRKDQHENYDQLLSEVHQKSANRLLQACLLNGGLFIKLGQGVANMNHLIPIEYTRTLNQLRDNCLPYSKTDVQKVFLKEFGKLPEEVYDEFNYKPVAAASLAQVFKATLNGETLAVKVQYYDLEERFYSDIKSIIIVQDIVELVHKNYNFAWIIRDLTNNLEKELDFMNEANNSEKCFNELKKNFNYVYVPKVNWEYTKRRILTMEWIDGYKITDLENLKLLNIDIYDLDKKLINIFAEQIFSTGFLHADPHPGNIFVRKTNSGKVEIIILDHGLYEDLPKAIILPLCKFWEATVLRDKAAMKKCVQNLSISIKHYKKFAEILFQAPFETHGKLKSKLSKEDIEYIQKKAKENFDGIMVVLKEMPRPLLLTIQNLNTIRAISQVHGDVVNRAKVMARYAQKCIYKNDNSITGIFKWLWHRLRFEYFFLITNMKMSLFCLYINILNKTNRSPEGCDSVFKKMYPEISDDIL